VKIDSGKATPEAQLRTFNARFDPKHQRFVRSVRAAVRTRLPTANELAYDYSSFFVIAYSPTDRGIDAIVSIAARADRVDLYFSHGPQLPDPKKLLLGSGKQTRFVRVEAVRQLAHPDVEAFIAAAIDLARVPLPSRGKGSLIIKTNKSVAAQKRPRRARLKRGRARRTASAVLSLLITLACFADAKSFDLLAIGELGGKGRIQDTGSVPRDPQIAAILASGKDAIPLLIEAIESERPFERPPQQVDSKVSWDSAGQYFKVEGRELAACEN
jgi:hypothetical protein